MNVRRLLLTHGRQFGTLAVLFVLGAVVAVLTPYFLTVPNLLNVAQQTVINAVVAVGMTYIIISAGIDLSVGSILAFAGVMLAHALHSGWPWPLALLAGIAVGVGCGAVNGLLISVGRLPPFIATLGMMSVARGAALLATDGRPVSGFSESFRWLANGQIASVPSPVVLMVLVYAVAHFVLRRTKFGRYVYAMGGNEEAALLSGVPVRIYKIAIYAVGGGLAALSAVLLTARLNSAQPIAGPQLRTRRDCRHRDWRHEPDGRGGLGPRHADWRPDHGRAAQRPQPARRLVVHPAGRDRRRHHRGRAPRYAFQATQTLIPTMKIHFPALLLVLGAGVLPGCGRKTAEQTATQKPLVALVVKTLNNPYFIEMQRGAEQAARTQGVELLVQAAEREIDVERQMQIVENLIQRHVSALIITPSGSREIVPVIVKANQAGIPVIIVDTRVDAAELKSAGGRIATFIGSDNEDGGRLAGQFMAERLGGHAKIAILEGIPGHETGDARLRGFRQALSASPGMVIVASQPANWERDQGYNVFQNILQAHPDVNALFAASDLMALGATEAIAAAGRTGKITVVGFDAQDEARQAVKKGTMAGTVAQNPVKMGSIGVEWAVKILRGETAPPEISVPIELIK